MSATRWYVIAGLFALTLLCATVLASIGVVDGGRVLDLAGTGMAGFVGALVGAKNGKSSTGTTIRPPAS